jgi:hypothetical protein
MMLNKRERNRIYEAIVKRKLDPLEFSLEDTGDTVIITHDSSSTFQFSPKTVNRTDDEVIFFGSELESTKYEALAKVAEGINETHTAKSIDHVIGIYFPSWLREIQLTVGVPDYWSQMQQGRKSLAIIQRGDFSNTPFTQTEQGQIAAQLQEVLKQSRKLFALTSTQMGQIEEKLDESLDAASRMGRKDWIVMFSGIILTLVVTDLVTWAAAHHMWTMVLHQLIDLFTGGDEPPQILA